MVPPTGGVGAGEGLKASEQLVYIAPDGPPAAEAPPPIDAPPPPPKQEPEFGAAGDGSTDLDGAIYAGPALAKGFQILSAPIGVPDRLPEIDLSRAVTDEMDFSGRGVAGGVARGVVGGVVPTDSVPQLFSTVGPKARSADAERVYFEFQVEKPVLRREGNPPPRYPEVMRNAGVEGDVMAQFVVDTTGRPIPGSLKILTSSHEMFSAAVRAIIPELRFYPAETGGRKVRMLVQQPYTFRMDAPPGR
jgi:periplasmic protein TonB